MIKAAESGECGSLSSVEGPATSQDPSGRRATEADAPSREQTLTKSTTRTTKTTGIWMDGHPSALPGPRFASRSTSRSAKKHGSHRARASFTTISRRWTSASTRIDSPCMASRHGASRSRVLRSATRAQTPFSEQAWAATRSPLPNLLLHWYQRPRGFPRSANRPV